MLKLAKAKGVKHGTVQDKLFLPGLHKLKLPARLRLLRPHALGARGVRLLGVRRRLAGGAAAVVELPQAEDGGGIILDMVCHWRYVLDNLFGEVESVTCLGTTDIPEARGTRSGKTYTGDRRRLRLRHLPAQGRRDRAHQHELGARGSTATTS